MYRYFCCVMYIGIMHDILMDRHYLKSKWVNILSRIFMYNFLVSSSLWATETRLFSVNTTLPLTKMWPLTLSLIYFRKCNCENIHAQSTCALSKQNLIKMIIAFQQKNYGRARKDFWCCDLQNTRGQWLPTCINTSVNIITILTYHLLNNRYNMNFFGLKCIIILPLFFVSDFCTTGITTQPENDKRERIMLQQNTKKWGAMSKKDDILLNNDPKMENKQEEMSDWWQNKRNHKKE